MLIALATLGLVVALARASFAVTVESHNLNLFRRILDGQWLGIRYATDGNCYFGSSTHCAHDGASFFKYDPRSSDVTMLREDITTLCHNNPYRFPQGKIHSDMVEANGWVYWTSHFSSELPSAMDIWPGAHLFGYQLKTGKFRDYGVIRKKCTCYAGFAVDVPRNLAYVYVSPMDAAGYAVSGGSHLYRYKLTSGAKTDLGVVYKGTYGTCFWLFVNQRGDCWFSQAYDHGNLRVARHGTNHIDVFKHALPKLYNWRTATVNRSSTAQDQRWIMWMQPLPDGNRAVFTEGYYGGMLYTFDSTKDVASGAAFKNVRFIGETDLGLAVCGNKVYYIQRANNQFGHQEYHDFHLLSVELNSKVTPHIDDLGLIEDQDSRTPWRIETLMTDGANTVFMDGDWWLNSGDVGTLRDNYDPTHADRVLHRASARTVLRRDAIRSRLRRRFQRQFAWQRLGFEQYGPQPHSTRRDTWPPRAHCHARFVERRRLLPVERLEA